MLAAPPRPEPALRLAACALALAVLPALAAAAPPKKLAVLEFEVGKKVEVDRRFFSTRLQNSARKAAPQLFVMTRENIEGLLKASGTSLEECEGQCAVETGRKIGADLVVSGRISQVGSKLALQMQLHRTDTGELIAGEEAIGKGEDELLDASAAAAQRLLAPLAPVGAAAPATAAAPAPAPKKATAPASRSASGSAPASASASESGSAKKAPGPVLGFTPAPGDQDGDGVPDSSDNCPNDPGTADPKEPESTGCPPFLHYKVTRVEMLQGLDARATLAAGLRDGLRLGGRAIAWGLGAKDAGLELLGEGTLTRVDETTATAEVKISKRGLRKGDLISARPALLSRSLPGPVARVAWLGIELQDADRKPFYGLRTFRRPDPERAEEELLPRMLANLHETGREQAWMASMKEKRTKGRYQGRTAGDVMRKATREDLLGFLAFVAEFPGKYMGHGWRLDEVFATWVINDAPNN